MTVHDPRAFDGPRHQELELQCAAALARGDIAQAFAFADRRCRLMPLADAHCYVLRADALHAMGHDDAALADLATALAIAPDDLAANRRMMAWGEGEERRRAAQALIRHDHDIAMLRQAIAVLRAEGADCFGMLQCQGDVIDGWAAWPSAGDLAVTIADGAGTLETLVRADASHPLASASGNAASVRLDLSAAAKPVQISLAHGGTVFASLRVGREAAGDAGGRSGAEAEAHDVDVTVIVPVYGDADATRRCFASLLDQLPGAGRHRLIVIDDASPDPRITSLLALLAGWPGVTVLRTSPNLGFVGAVNRALAEIPGGDVILLNADTVVPDRFIDRLAAVARTAPDIGTVTPLSNNGEFTSFPFPNRSNPEGSGAELRRIDAIAARVNEGCVVDLPNGIGFCLYITRACLDAVGGLSESYHRGYLEDVDVCLRVRQHGFRNVCAPSVYVGHAGSRSFGGSKRALVVRNLAVIEQRFPDYRRECADFLLADPLKAARRAIEAELALAPGATLVVVCGRGAVAEIAEARARHLVATDQPALLLRLCAGPSGPVAELRNAGEGAPQSLDFALAQPRQRDELLDLLGRAGLERIELFDLARVPPAVLKALLALGVPYDIAICHGGLGLGWTADGDGDSSAARDDKDAGCRAIARAADGLLAPDLRSAIAATRLGLALPCWKLELGLPEPVTGPAASAPAKRLALIPIRKDVGEASFIRAVAAGLRRHCPDLDLVLMGEPIGLDEVPGLFATGTIAAGELGAALRHYGVDRILLCQTQPLFGHPLAAAALATPLPVAMLERFAAGRPGRAGDVVLEPWLSTETIVSRLLPWLRGQERA
ncbi:MAG: glycosyltransferase [Xanthobacteraceae bacterium]|nr:glycosyltransferase [Xanthobacteraceae bacterium]